MRQQRIKKEVVTIDDIAKKDTSDDDYEDDFIELEDLKKTASAVTKSAQKEKPVEAVKEEKREPLVKPLKIIDKLDINDLPGARKKPAEKVTPAEPPVSKPQQQEPAETAVSSEKPITAEKPVEKIPETPAKEETVKKDITVETVQIPDQEPMVAEKKVEIISEPKTEEKAPVVTVEVQDYIKTDVPRMDEPKVIGRIDLGQINSKTRPDRKSREERDVERKLRTQKEKEARRKVRPQTEPEQTVPGTSDTEQFIAKPDVIRAKADRLAGPTIVGKIDLPSDKDKKVSEEDRDKAEKEETSETDS
jgi:translation initiation factor IF-2